MNYKNYSLEDFLTDDFFLKWVKNPDDGSNRFWQQWLANHPHKKQEVMEASEIILSISYEKEYILDEISRSEIIARILTRLQGNKEIFGKQKHFQNWQKIAASIAVFLLVGSGLYFSKVHQSTESVNPTVKYITKSTSEGQKLSLTLYDGSTMKLNSSAVVSFPEQFSDSTREVRVLEGEVFFDVVKNKERSFIVHTGNYSTRVLGTAFNIHYLKHSKTLEVALVRGSVKVTEGNNTHYLKPEEKLYVSEEKVQKSKFDIMKTTGWKDGVLIFDKLTFSEAIQKMEEWYGVKFNYQKKDNGIYSGTFEQESLENVLIGLGFATNFKYEINNNIINLK